MEFRNDPQGIDLLHQYHYWYVSFDEFNVDLYNKLNKEIALFNINHEKLNCSLAAIISGDSDNYGTFYFTISVSNKDGSFLEYTIPSHLVESSEDEDNFKVSYFKSQESFTIKPVDNFENRYKAEDGTIIHLSNDPWKEDFLSKLPLYIKSENLLVKLLNLKPGTVEFQTCWDEIQSKKDTILKTLE
jgi:hypothetical protein